MLPLGGKLLLIVAAGCELNYRRRTLRQIGNSPSDKHCKLKIANAVNSTLQEIIYHKSIILSI